MYAKKWPRGKLTLKLPGPGQLDRGLQVYLMSQIYNPPVVVHFPGTVVHNAIGPAAYTDINISTVVGVRRAWVLIRVENQTGSGGFFYFRENGETLLTSGAGTQITSITAPNRFGYVILRTDNTGILEWYAGVVAGTVNLRVEAYIHE